MRIDLHTHSNASDGTDSPTELMANAARANLDVIAITDHDTTAGWAEATTAAAEHRVALVRGTEFTTRSDGISVHMLSYLHDPDAPALAARGTAARTARELRARQMVELLARDFTITWADVIAQTVAGTVVGRPHIADALVALGYVPDRSAAFAQILGPGSPYYVPHPAPDPLDMITTILEAGGVPVLAHPGATQRGRVLSDTTIAQLAEAGLVGLEVEHRDNDDEQRVRLRGLADKHGLITTGSSDYHGAGKPNRLGEFCTPPESLAEIERRGALKVIRHG